MIDGLALIVGIMIGSGIFRTPGLVAGLLGRPGLTFVAWTLGGGVGLLGALSGALAVFAGRPWLPVLAAAAAVLVWAYNFAPLRLAYRGHGEVVQGLGTGVVLPLIGFYVQAGGFAGFVVWSLVPMLLLGAVGSSGTSPV